MRIMLFAFYGYVLFACASEPQKPITKASPATWVNDLFQVEQGMPVREVKKQEFYFKKCNVESSSRPFYTHTEYSCNEGPL
jgi:hypothetical protein